MSDETVKSALRSVYWRVVGDPDTLLTIFLSLLASEVDSGRRAADVVSEFESLVNEIARRYGRLKEV